MMTTKNPIYLQDEILQILFWMRGEGLGEVVTLEEVNRFLTIEKSNLNDTVESLVEMGYLELSTNPISQNNFPPKRWNGLKSFDKRKRIFKGI